MVDRGLKIGAETQKDYLQARPGLMLEKLQAGLRIVSLIATGSGAESPTQCRKI